MIACWSIFDSDFYLFVQVADVTNIVFVCLFVVGKVQNCVLVTVVHEGPFTLATVWIEPIKFNVKHISCCGEIPRILLFLSVSSLELLLQHFSPFTLLTRRK
jgi:hypothetical protein